MWLDSVIFTNFIHILIRDHLIVSFGMCATVISLLRQFEWMYDCVLAIDMYVFYVFYRKQKVLRIRWKRKKQQQYQTMGHIAYNKPLTHSFEHIFLFFFIRTYLHTFGFVIHLIWYAYEFVCYLLMKIHQHS